MATMTTFGNLARSTTQLSAAAIVISETTLEIPNFFAFLA